MIGYTDFQKSSTKWGSIKASSSNIKQLTDWPRAAVPVVVDIPILVPFANTTDVLPYYFTPGFNQLGNSS